MNSSDAGPVPATIAVRTWGPHGLWVAIVMDGSTVVARFLGLSEDAAFDRARAWAAPRAVYRARWVDIPAPRGADEDSAVPGGVTGNDN